MEKIPTMFKRDPEDMRRVLPEVTPGCEWVLAGEGVATRKYDGTCVMFDGEAWWARREVKPGKTAPEGFEPVGTDPNTGKTVGWEPIEQSPFVKAWHEAVLQGIDTLGAGTFELCGPKINGNPEGYTRHFLIRHAVAQQVPKLARDYEGLRNAVLALRTGAGWEGIVWHHPDGRMAKLKARDFPASASPEGSL